MEHRLRAKLLARQADLRNGRRPFPATRFNVARLAAGRRRCSRCSNRAFFLSLSLSLFDRLVFLSFAPVNNVGVGLGGEKN